MRRNIVSAASGIELESWYSFEHLAKKRDVRDDLRHRRLRKSVSAGLRFEVGHPKPILRTNIECHVGHPTIIC